MIYFDCNATTPVLPEVLEAMLPYLRDEFGNASSVHQLGQRSRKAIEDARAQVAGFIGAEPSEIVFTSGGTESNNFAIKGALAAKRIPGKRVVSSAIEHSSVRDVLRFLSDTGQIDNVIAPVERNGIVTPEAFRDATTDDTFLVCLMSANNETGAIQPMAAVAESSRKKGALVHCDAVQSGGKLPIDVSALGADTLALSGHKFGAPKGTGVLYVRKGTRLASLIHGGRQERNRRGGTENVAGIVGLGRAAEHAKQALGAEAVRIRQLRDLLEGLLMKQVPSTLINGDREKRVGNTTNVCFEYTDSSAMVMALDLKGIACSNGSACAAGSPDASHVLLAMGLPQDKAHASIRFSLGHMTKEEDIKAAVPLIAETVSRLRKSNPLWAQAAKQ